jgi:hypothetical protein
VEELDAIVGVENKTTETGSSRSGWVVYASCERMRHEAVTFLRLSLIARRTKPWKCDGCAGVELALLLP